MNPKMQFTLLEVAEIRLQYARGVLDARAWADARKCSPETIRRIARGDTYRHVGGQAAHHAWGGLEAHGQGSSPRQPTYAASQGLAVPQQARTSTPAFDPSASSPIPVGEVLAGEPTDEDAAASFARLQAALAEASPDEARRERANALVEELRAKAEPPKA